MNEPGGGQRERVQAHYEEPVTNRENTGKKRSTEAIQAFSGSKFANANKGVTTILQLL